MKAIFILTLLIFLSCSPEPPIRERPEIFIISIDLIHDFEMRAKWIVQFAIDGRVENAVIPRSKGYEAFVDYLRSVSRVR